MTVISEPDPKTRTIFDFTPEAPPMKGAGQLSYVCGSCETTLLQSIELEQVEGVVYRCGKCREFNEIPRTDHT
jgi:DNA-directed RNA polymerase subunit RPC12/RpoP